MSLTSLSLDCLAYIVNGCQLSGADVANVRASCKSLERAVNATLQAIQPTNGDPVAISTLLRKLPALTHLTLGHCCGVFPSVTNYTRLAEYIAPLLAMLSCHSSLTSLTLSTSDLQHLGSLKWAHNLCANQQAGASQAKPRSMSKWYKGEYADFAADSNHQVYWLPDQLASPPGLQKLVLQPPSCNGAHHRRCHGAYRSSSCTPACLWFSPKVWADKLNHLELHGAPVVTRLPPGLSQLSKLRTVGLVDCSLQPEGLAQLLRQVAKGGILLRSLLLRGNELWKLPKESWQAVNGVQELDLSHNLLIDLPLGLSHLTSLTSLQLQHNQLATVPLHLSTLKSLKVLDLSHNWLSGLNNTPHFGQLVASWRQLSVLKLANVSDKRGRLVLPVQLRECRLLSELYVGDNHEVDWRALEMVVDKCEDLRVLDLSYMREGTGSASLQSKVESQKHRIRVNWHQAF